MKACDYPLTERVSPSCCSDKSSDRPTRVPRFCDGKTGIYKPQTEVMNTWIEAGFIPPELERIAKQMFDIDSTWKAISKKLEAQ